MNISPPPAKMLTRPRIEQRKEDQNRRNRHRAIHSRAQNKVILLPPLLVTPLDPQPKHQPHDAPTAVVDTRRWRDVVQTAQEQRHVNMLEPLGVGEDAGSDDVDDDGQGCADEEEPE